MSRSTTGLAQLLTSTVLTVFPWEVSALQLVVLPDDGAGEDKQVADAVRQLTPKVTALAEQVGTKKRDFERLSTEMQKAPEHFRDVANKRPGNVKE